MPTLIEGLGTELLIDEVFLVIRENLNDAIAYIEAGLRDHDQMMADQLGVNYVPFDIERVDPTPRGKEFPYGNFHIGDIPSFVQTEDRVMNYPMAVVMPGQTVPDAEDASMDQLNVYLNAVQIHSFARANPAEGPEVAYRRAMRMAEAVHRVVHTSTNLWQLVAGVSGPTLVTRSDPWYFPAEDGHGDDWIWRAVMHQYQVKNYSTTP